MRNQGGGSQSGGELKWYWLYGRLITATGWTFEQVDDLTWEQVRDLFKFCSEQPQKS